MLTENREFNEIYEQYKNLILKAAYTYSGSYSAAEDITQDTFLKLYMGYDSMKKKNISSWLFTTAKNAALNYRKKHSREIFEIDENWDSEEDTEKYEAQVYSAEEQFLEDDLQKQRLELHEKIFTNLMEKKRKHPSPKPRKKHEKPVGEHMGGAFHPKDDGYDGYYDDVLPSDAGKLKEGPDMELVKKVSAVAGVMLLIVILCVVAMYLL